VRGQRYPTSVLLTCSASAMGYGAVKLSRLRIDCLGTVTCRLPLHARLTGRRNEAPRFHHAARRRGSLARDGARAAGSDADRGLRHQSNPPGAQSRVLRSGPQPWAAASCVVSRRASHVLKCPALSISRIRPPFLRPGAGASSTRSGVQRS
jgi:hypothetical protein